MQRVGDAVAYRTGTRVADDHGDLAGLADGEDALDLLRGSPPQPWRIAFATASCTASSTPMISASDHWRSRSSSGDPVSDCPDAAGSAGMMTLNWHAEQYGHECRQALDAGQLHFELLDELRAFGFRAVTRGESVGELHEFGSQLELGLGLAPRGP